MLFSYIRPDNRIHSIMKQILMALFTLLALTNAYGQSCQQIDIAPDPLRKRILQEYVEECRQERYFFEDKGIIKLITYQDAKGRLNWSLMAMVDDRYKDNPTKNYSLVGETLILVYQADSVGRTNITPPLEKHALNECLESVVLDRVYQRPVGKDRLVDPPTINGKSKKIRARTLNYGNQWNSKRIIFYSDGTYKILIGV